MYMHYQYRFVGDGRGTKAAVYEIHDDEHPRVQPYNVWLVPGTDVYECGLMPQQPDNLPAEPCT